MKCPRCQAENDERLKFCEDCGARLARACPNCGAHIRAGKKFCGECGTTLDTAPTRFASPDQYTPKHLAERILLSKEALEGERKQVTVLFSDMKSSMQLLADRDPEEARKLLDPVLEQMMEAVHRFEGTVNQVLGDGIMALFGAPLAHEDHAVRACYAAMKMQDRIKRYAEQIRRTHGVNIEIRVGINSGEVVVRAIDNDLHMDYSAIGETTHLAARMEQLANAGCILLTPSTVAFVEGYVTVKPLGPVPVKGLPNPVEVYEITGSDLARSRLQAAARRGLTRFVGRDAELEQLRRAQQLAGNGHGQIAAVVGEAGVGKSRLIYEFTHSHRLHGWLVLEGASVSYGRATSYLPVIDLLKTYFKIGDRDDQREIRERVTGKLLTLDESLRPILTALLALLDVPNEDTSWISLDPAQRRQRTLDALRRLLLREAREQPLLVIFEDLHWIDAETQALLDSLVESLASAHLLLLVNYRPEYQHSWGSKTYYSQMRVDALPAESAEELLAALLGDDPGLAPLKQLLVKRGNPFFLEETVRTLIETKSLLGQRGAYRLTQPVPALQIPATVQAMLAARIDRLPSEHKRLLQIASVVGKDVPFALLQANTELDDDALRRGLDYLQAAEFIYETGLFPDLEYSFKHALTHEVTYGGMLKERRRAIHASILAAMEKLYGHRLEAEIERLAYHAFRGELWTQAASYLEQAGDKAMARCAFADATAWFEQAITTHAHLPQTREALEQGIDIRFDLRNALIQVGDTERMHEHLIDAQRIAQDIGDQPRLARASGYLSYAFLKAGNYQRALEAGQLAIDIGEALGNRPLILEMDFRLGQVYAALGQYGRALTLLDHRAQLGESEALRDPLSPPFPLSLHAKEWMGYCMARIGDFAVGIGLLEAAIPVAEDSGLPFALAAVYYSLCDLYVRQGLMDKATPVLERAFELGLAKNLHVYVPGLQSLLGLARCRTGLIRDGLALLEESAKQWQKVVSGHGALLLCNLSEGYLLADRGGDALRAATQGLELARSRKEKGNEAWALYMLGEVSVHAARNGAQTAEAHYHEALALATELGMRPLIAHCHFGLRHYLHTGRADCTRENVVTAATMYREMEMQSWLEKAEAALKDLSGKL